MKNLKINVPDGYEIDKDRSTFDNIVFKKKNIELPTYWCKSYDGYTQTEVLGFSELGVRFAYKTKEQARASVALAKLSQLRDVYRQGWEPDWELYGAKYCVVFVGDDTTVKVTTNESEFLSFQEKQTAYLFLENFKDLIEQAKPLMS